MTNVASGTLSRITAAILAVLVMAGPSLAFSGADELAGKISSTFVAPEVKPTAAKSVKDADASLPGLSLFNTDRMSLNMTYAYRAADNKSGKTAQGLATYGVNALTKFGKDSSIKSMLYMSSPQNGSPIVNQLASTPGAAAKQPPPKGKSDSLIVEEGQFGLGAATIKLGFQDVGEAFNGFTALKDSEAAPGEVLAQLAKEKGLKRFELGGTMDLGHGMSFSVGTNSIADKADKITSQSLAFTSGRAKLSYSSSEVGKKFARAKDLREANRDQLAKEAGMSRSNLSLELASSGGKDAPWNALRMNTVSDASGKINTNALGLSFGKLGMNYYSRSVDKGFARLGSLSKDEATQMALEIRQQFDAGATAAQITDADRQQILAETGIERTGMRFGFAGDSSKADIQTLHIGDEKGGADRRAISYSGRNFGLNLIQQSVSESFRRVNTLSPTEKAAFGNEWGMSRTGLTGRMKLSGSDVGFGFSRVTDQKGASILKQSISLAGKNMNVKANFLNHDADFDRDADLSDADRGELQKERGSRRTDIAANFTMGRLNLDSFYLTSNNDSAKSSRNQMRNKLSYTTKQGAKLSLFRDSNSTVDANGKASGYLRQWFTVENRFALFGGLGFNGTHDTNTTTDAAGNSVTATIDQMHLESDKSRKTWAIIDTKNSDFGNGKFENLRTLNFASKLAKNANVTTSLASIDRESGSEDTRGYGLQWGLTKALNFNASAMNKTGSKSGVTAKRDYGLSGILTERFMMFHGVKVAAVRSDEEKDGKSAKSVTSYSIESAVPKLSLFTNGKLSFSTNTEDKEGRLLKDATAFKFESDLLKGKFAVDYASATDDKQNHPLSRALSFASDRNAKRLLFDLVIKERDLGPGDPLSIRRYGLNYKFSRKTTLTYSSFAYQEKPDGKVDQIGGTTFNLATTINQFSVALNFKQDDNFAARTSRGAYGLSFSGKLRSDALVEFGFSFDSLSAPGVAAGSGHTLHAKYDHKISDDHYLTLTGDVKTFGDGNPGLKKDLQARVDFKMLWK